MVFGEEVVLSSVGVNELVHHLEGVVLTGLTLRHQIDVEVVGSEELLELVAVLVVLVLVVDAVPVVDDAILT